MIVPMKKVSLIVLDGERKHALKKLRKLGLLHIEIKEGKGTAPFGAEGADRFPGKRDGIASRRKRRQRHGPERKRTHRKRFP